MLKSLANTENYYLDQVSDDTLASENQSLIDAEFKPSQETIARLLKFPNIPSASSQVVSKQRVANYGEVYTNPREVSAMLDLVKTETERVDSTFLEPACGTGNFLIEILCRKLAVVAKRYKRSQLEYERKAVLAVSSLYGIDILADNIAICHARLFNVFNIQYTALYKTKYKQACRNTVRYLLKRNILQGDTLKHKTVEGEPIIFSEWKFPFNDSRIQRREFLFEHMCQQADGKAPPIKSHSPIHFLELGDAE